MAKKPVTYTRSQDGAAALRSSDSVFVPWDAARDRPADIGGMAGRLWQEHGEPASLPYSPSIDALVLPAPDPDAVPQSVAIADWRIGLMRWGRLEELNTNIANLIASPNQAQHTTGMEARERLEYTTAVYRPTLLLLAPALGFTEADVDESLKRGAAVAAEVAAAAP